MDSSSKYGSKHSGPNGESSGNKYGGSCSTSKSNQKIFLVPIKRLTGDNPAAMDPKAPNAFRNTYKNNKKGW